MRVDLKRELGLKQEAAQIFLGREEKKLAGHSRNSAGAFVPLDTGNRFPKLARQQIGKCPLPVVNVRALSQAACSSL